MLLCMGQVKQGRRPRGGGREERGPDDKRWAAEDGLPKGCG